MEIKQFEIVFEKDGREGYELLYAKDENEARTKFILNNKEKKIKTVKEIE